MTDQIDIRDYAVSDAPQLEALYPAAFPGEDLLPLLRALLADSPNALSLVAIADGSLIAHIAVTPCEVEDSAARGALVGPLAVAPDWQSQGIGGALIHAGLRRLHRDHVAQVFVLGDPGYYGRHGFKPERQVSPPFVQAAESLPDAWKDAWQSLTLGDAPPLTGALVVPAYWRRRELWTP